MNLRRFLLSALLLLSATIAFAQKNKAGNYFLDTATITNYEWKSVNIGFPEETEFYGETLSDSILRIDTISREVFETYSKKYHSKINADSSVITKTDSSFTLKNAYFEKTFPAFRICECTASTYGGIIAPLNLYIVSSVDMHNEIAYMVLYDYKTGKPFEVPTNCDPGPQAVLISPQNNLLLTYSSSYYEHDNCAVYLMRVNRNKTNHTFRLENDFVINFDRLNIEELVWINESSFAMSVTEQINPDDYENKIRYYLQVTVSK